MHSKVTALYVYPNIVFSEIHWNNVQWHIVLPKTWLAKYLVSLISWPIYTYSQFSVFCLSVLDYYFTLFAKVESWCLLVWPSLLDSLLTIRLLIRGLYFVELWWLPSSTSSSPVGAEDWDWVELPSAQVNGCIFCRNTCSSSVFIYHTGSNCRTNWREWIVPRLTCVDICSSVLEDTMTISDLAEYGPILDRHVCPFW